jgi:N12 class adenine-specific DNA methylase
MPLPYKLKSKDEVSDELLNLYVERDGVFVLDVSGVTDKSHADELKKSNADLLQQLSEHQQRFEGIGPDEVRKLSEEKRKLEEQQLLKTGEVERVVESRLKQATLTWEKQLGAVTAERDALNARLVSIQIDQAVVTEATKRGLRATAPRSLSPA